MVSLKPEDGIWLLPSYKRPQRLQKLLNSIIEVGSTTRGLVLTDASDEYDYSTMAVPPGWGIVKLTVETEGRNAVINRFFSDNPIYGWYGLLEDDMVVRTKDWDKKMVEACDPYGFVTANDKWLTPARLRGAKIVGGNLLRLMGRFAPEGCRHSFMHEFHEDIAVNFRCGKNLADVVIEEEHPNNRKAQIDDVYRRTVSWLQQDQAAFDAYCNTRRLDLFKAIGAATNKIVRVSTFDKYNVAIATPCHGNKVEINYLHSIVGMTHLMRTHNARFELLTVPNEALVIRSRNHLVWQFMQTQCTHLFFLDSDMGCKAHTILRLLSHEKDLVAGVGRRKQAGPPSYCANLIVPPKVDSATGLWGAVHVGTACMLISRNCIERMLAAYGQLKYFDTQANRYEVALFDTEMRDGLFWSEDYTFCRRWRDIGGEIWVDPEIWLEHVGFTSWDGAMVDDLGRSNTNAAPTAVPDSSVAADTAGVKRDAAPGQTALVEWPAAAD